MTIRIIREPSQHGATLGVVFVNDQFFSFSLEDQLREVKGQPVESWKVKGQTAIPEGVYRCRLSWSPKFQKVLPEVLEVPGFTGIRIHSGNRHEDSEGCVLIGFQRANAVISESRAAMARLIVDMDVAKDTGEPITLLIENPPGYGV